jgi:hypothetical protein
MDIHQTYLKTSGGAGFDVCTKWLAERNARAAEMSTLAKELGATPDKWLTAHSLVALHFSSKPDTKLWKRDRQFPTYWSPKASTKAGKELDQRFRALVVIGPEDLAKRLGCQPFFNQPGVGGFCTAIGCVHRDGTFYLDAPTFGMPSLKDYPDLIRIPRGEYFTATD